ncbi:MAG: hypothetical protein ACQER6_05830 [Pseudomonadota bacterium]
MDARSALDWLGIESYRPSGRVRPVVPPQTGGEASVEADPQAREAPGTVEVEEKGVEPRVEQPVGEMPVESAPPQTDEPAEDAVLLAAQSTHRGLGEAIARAGRLSCRDAVDPNGEGVRLAGRLWSFDELVGNAGARRRLWKALVTRPRSWD